MRLLIFFHYFILRYETRTFETTTDGNKSAVPTNLNDNFSRLTLSTPNNGVNGNGQTLHSSSSSMSSHQKIVQTMEVKQSSQLSKTTQNTTFRPQ